MEYTGTIVRIGSTNQVSDKFRKREFVVTDNATSYPQTIQFEFTQDRCDKLDGFKPGDEVRILFNLKGREWKNPQGDVKVFNTLQAFDLAKTGNAPKPSETLTPIPENDLHF